MDPTLDKMIGLARPSLTKREFQAAILQPDVRDMVVRKLATFDDDELRPALAALVEENALTEQQAALMIRDAQACRCFPDLDFGEQEP